MIKLWSIFNVLTLKALGVTAEQYGNLLISVIMTKFPSDICLWIALETGREAWKITLLLDIIKNEVEALKASEGAAMSINKPTVPGARNLPPPRASSLVTNLSNCKPNCICCDEEHYSASCTKVTSVADWKGVLMKPDVALIVWKPDTNCEIVIVPEPADIVTIAIISQYAVTFQPFWILKRLARSLQVLQQEEMWVRKWCSSRLLKYWP